VQGKGVSEATYERIVAETGDHYLDVDGGNGDHRRSLLLRMEKGEEDDKVGGLRKKKKTEEDEENDDGFIVVSKETKSKLTLKSMQ
jgi:hypothetical protein